MDEQMINYLHEIENESNFVPWDDDRHAVANLVTVFGASEVDAMAAVKAANVSTKEPAGATVLASGAGWVVAEV